MMCEKNRLFSDKTISNYYTYIAAIIKYNNNNNTKANTISMLITRFSCKSFRFKIYVLIKILAILYVNSLYFSNVFY